MLPIMIDELASTFNIGTILSLHPNFEGMSGFIQSEVDGLLDEVYADYEIAPDTRPKVNALIKNHYNGYHFASTKGDALYNSTVLAIKAFAFFQCSLCSAAFSIQIK